MATIYFFSYFQRTAVPGTIFDDLQRDLGIRAASVAALGSMFTWIYGAMQVLVGLWSDRYGGSRTLMGGGLVMLAGAVLFPLTHTVWGAFAARAVTGFGASFMYLSLVKEMDRLLGHRHFTLWMGVILVVGYAGGMAATLPFERAAAAFGWRQSLLVAAAGLFVALTLTGMVLRRLGSEVRRNRPFSIAPIAEVLANRACRPLLLGSLVAFPILFVIQTVLGKKFLQDFAGMSSRSAATFILIMSVVTAASSMLGGWLPSLVRNRRKPWCVAGAALTLLSALVLLGGVLGRAPGWVFMGAYLLLALAGSATASGAALMKESNRPESVALSLSVTNGLAYIGCGTLGQVGGVILDCYRGQAVATSAGLVYPREAYVALFLFVAGLAVLNLLAASFVKETHGRHDLLPEGAA